MWTHDTVYFFMDFTLAKTPLVGAALLLLMLVLFRAVCLLSSLKWAIIRRLELGRPTGDPSTAGEAGGAEGAGGEEPSAPYLPLPGGA